MKPIPAPSRTRLVMLAQILAQHGGEKITSGEIAALSRWNEATIRRDISLLELHAGAPSGYNARELRAAICTAFGIDDGEDARRCCIVGLGEIGGALLAGGLPAGCGFKIAAGFDSNTNRIELLSAEFPLYPTAELERVVQGAGIEFALLAVPDGAAQATAARLAACGIRGIVNYTGAALALPGSVAVENVSPVTALTSLLAKVRQQ